MLRIWKLRRQEKLPPLPKGRRGTPVRFPLSNPSPSTLPNPGRRDSPASNSSAPLDALLGPVFLSPGVAPGGGQGPAAPPPSPAPSPRASRPPPSEVARPRPPRRWAGQLQARGPTGSGSAPIPPGAEGGVRGTRPGARATSTWRPPEDKALSEQGVSASSNGAGGGSARGRQCACAAGGDHGAQNPPRRLPALASLLFFGAGVCGPKKVHIVGSLWT